MKITEVRIDEDRLLRLLTDGDHEGWSAGVDTQAQLAIEQTYAGLVVGQTPMQRERIWRQLVDAGRASGLGPSSWAHVDIALWDLLGKELGLPVFRVIGGFRDRVPAYLNGNASPDAATAACDQGYWGYKFPARPGSAMVSTLQAIRAAVGDEFRLLADGRRQCTLEEALALGRDLEGVDAHWFEEPLRDSDLTGYKKLSDGLDVPVVAGTFADHSMLAGTQALTAVAVDRLRACLPRSGGITDVLKLLRGAEALGVNCELEWDRQCGPHACAHLLGAARNVEMFSADADDGGDLDLSVVDGELQIPVEPGLGHRFDGR
ncbi:MAG: enolase C-terminal domain-like protein [Candidatus Latescibacterota bacterium]|nr:enolase C-terminal domain-like protein [Candidatus Latescibacterota bacterium]